MVASPAFRPALVLRRRDARDMAALADLWVASWQEAMPDIDFAARRGWLADHIVGLEAQGFVTLCAAERAGSLAGFVTLDPTTGWVDQLAVAPSAKGGGAARLLLDEARRVSPRGLSLDVNVDNPRALRFYEREGFTKIGEGVNPRSGLATLRLLRHGDD
jgi:putative acetyltransferase